MVCKLRWINNKHKIREHACLIIKTSSNYNWTSVVMVLNNTFLHQQHKSTLCTSLCLFTWNAFHIIISSQCYSQVKINYKWNITLLNLCTLLANTVVVVAFAMLVGGQARAGWEVNSWRAANNVNLTAHFLLGSQMG